MSSDTNRADAAKKLGEMIKGIRIAMMTTSEADGTLRSRPMATQEQEFDGDLWFFTGESSEKVHELQQDRHVNISYADPSDNRYVSVSGTAQFVRDQAKIDELWNPILKAWFPKGKDDPEIMLIRINVSQAEYWDSPSSTMVQIAGFLKAVTTGQRIQGGENEKLSL